MHKGERYEAYRIACGRMPASGAMGRSSGREKEAAR
jgi:hypothetical protein